ncbi:lec-5 [Pristionchus pacificus]|uniref:Galectin n=1 Tax=Pristionchus pacificus TaxID=54126 RepID=A0A2A6CXA3_PRIPA|nr:lec-5 [Pristionchus pacificus]|eukprot:PDM82661.1 lec-5 [Pristionchus pacificus]
MSRWLIALCLIGLVAAAPKPGDESGELQSEGGHDPKKSKETNYKLLIGEQDFRLPFKTRVVQSFVSGQTIHTLGKINEKPTRIDFNFHKGVDKDADMPLHFSIRFDEGIFHSKFIYNTFLNGNWSEDEQRINNPFKADKDFDLRVRIENNTYHVFANRKDVGKFEIRQPLDGIDHVSIRGDLTNLRLFHYGGSHFIIPYHAIANLVPGKRLDISGVPTGKRFDVSLYRENSEYALSLSFRFNEGVIVRNAMQNNMWGREERDGGLPLNKGEVFDLTIINEEFSIQIFVNGKRFSTFMHRGSPKDFKTLGVDGEVELHTVTINDAVGA